MIQYKNFTAPLCAKIEISRDYALFRVIFSPVVDLREFLHYLSLLRNDFTIKKLSVNPPKGPPRGKRSASNHPKPPKSRRYFKGDISKKTCIKGDLMLN
jgi:hypothetical protein